ncbi:MAG: hypothetical protein M1546_02955 [Chloroflexi bacterium]|nr:hypothetical protein [Chloroflexota bacterium]
MRLSRAQKHVLLAMANQCLLKSHRDIEGNKAYKLHPLEGPAQDVAPAVVEALSGHGLIDRNKKFPAATYWLTEKGKGLVATLR